MGSIPNDSSPTNFGWIRIKTRLICSFASVSNDLKHTLTETARLNKRLPKDHLLSAKALMAAYKNIMQTGSLNSLK